MWLDHPQLQVEVPDPDPVQVQGELHAYLVQRGRQIAQDMDLGHVEDQDLVRLGELDAIAQHPDVNPGLAVDLETIASKLDHNPHGAWRGRTRSTSNDQRLDQLLAQRAETAPEPGEPDRPSESGIRDSSGVDRGLPSHQSRSQSRSHARNVMIEKKG